MWEFFREVYKVLDDEGLLIVWFTHSDPKAWEAIVGSLYAAGFALSKAWPVWTEMAQRRVALFTSAFFTSLALVLRKRSVADVVTTGESESSKLIQDENVKRTISYGVFDALSSAYNSKASGLEIFIMGLAGAIAGVTRVWNPDIDRIKIQTESLEVYFDNEEEEPDKLRFKSALQYFGNTLYPAAIYIGSSTMLEDTFKKAKLEDAVRDILSSDNLTQAYLIFWVTTRFSDSNEIPYDFMEKICKILKINYNQLSYVGLLAQTQKSYKILFGKECYDAIKGRIPALTKTVAGQAIHLLKMIGELPKDDVKKIVKEVLNVMPVSHSVAATALFLLRTAKSNELNLVGLSELTRDVVDKALELLYRGVY